MISPNQSEQEVEHASMFQEFEATHGIVKKIWTEAEYMVIIKNKSKQNIEATCKSSFPKILCVK